MKALQEVKSHIARLRANVAEGAILRRLEVPKVLMDALREELGLADGAPVNVDGVDIKEQDPREHLLWVASIYAYHRWNINLSHDDATSLFKAVPLEELEALIPIIIDQHMDDHGYEDPIDDMNYLEVDELRKTLKEVGFVDVKI